LRRTRRVDGLSFRRCRFLDTIHYRAWNREFSSSPHDKDLTLVLANDLGNYLAPVFEVDNFRATRKGQESQSQTEGSERQEQARPVALAVGRVQRVWPEALHSVINHTIGLQAASRQEVEEGG
jgi:hypothetical protein